MNSNQRFATIDLGTNTVRILVVETNGAGYTCLHAGQEMTRLGEGLHNSGKLGDEAMERTANTVAKLLDSAEPYAPFDLLINVTSAGRQASNTGELETLIHDKTGHGINVISWEEEARLTLKGVAMELDIGDRDFVLFDIGGGSTEFILSSRGEMVSSFGTDLGVVRLSEEYLTAHPVIDTEYENMKREIRDVVADVFRNLDVHGEEAMVGTAGSVTSLAAMDLGLTSYHPDKVNNYRLTADALGRLYKHISVMTIDERSKINALQGGREDLVIPGIAIVEVILEQSKQDHITVSDNGLREGLIIEMIENA